MPWSQFDGYNLVSWFNFVQSKYNYRVNVSFPAVKSYYRNYCGKNSIKFINILMFLGKSDEFDETVLEVTPSSLDYKLLLTNNLFSDNRMFCISKSIAESLAFRFYKRHLWIKLHPMKKKLTYIFLNLVQAPIFQVLIFKNFWMAVLPFYQGISIL